MSGDRPWLHLAIAGQHVVSMTRDYPAGVTVSVATCQCGWACCARISKGWDCYNDAAVEAHWRDVIAAADGAAS